MFEKLIINIFYSTFVAQLKSNLFTYRMESSGRPEQVHISDKTSKFLNDNYVLEDGEEVDGN